METHEKDQETLYNTFISKIEEAKKKGEEASLALYAVCLEFEQSDAWRFSNMPFLKLISIKGVNAAKYTVYKSSITLLGDESPRAMGLAALGEIMRIFKVKVEGGDLAARTAMTETYRRVLERFSLFRTEHKTTPSTSHAVNIVREEAEKLGVQAEPKNKSSAAHELAKTKTLLDKAVAALEQIADLSQEHAKAAPALAASTLERLGFRKNTQMAS